MHKKRIANSPPPIPTIALSSPRTVGVVEHALLQRHDDELAVAEVRAEHGADVLRVAEVERRIHLVENVQGRGLEQQQRQDEAQRQEGPLPAAQLRERLFPNAPEGHLHLEPGQDGAVAVLGGLQLGVRAREERRKDRTEIAVHLNPRRLHRARNNQNRR